jgi:hypothetical protein
MDATHPPTSTLHYPTSVGQLFDVWKLTFGSCFLKILKYHKNLWLQFFEKILEYKKKSLLVNSDFLSKIQIKEPSVLPKHLLYVFFWKNVTFWMKTIGKNLDFLKCDILPISDITKLRGKKKQQWLVYSRTGFWTFFIEKPGNFFFFLVKYHHFLIKKLGKFVFLM